MKKVIYPKKAIITVGKPDGHKDIHIGHLAGGLITSDIFARFLRNRIGIDNVLFFSGTECYGTSVYEEFIKQQEYEMVEEYIYSNYLKQSQMLSNFQVYLNEFFCDCNCSELHNIHTCVCQRFIDSLIANGDILQKKESILVDPDNNCFLNYRQISYLGDDSKKAIARRYNTEDVMDIISNISGKTPIKEEVQNYFIDILKRKDTILELHKTNYQHINKYTQNVLNELIDSIRLTCSANMGINVTINNETKRVWNWIDSLIAPISYTLYYLEKQNRDMKEWEKWWCNEDAKVFHFIAEDNVLFYTIVENYLIQSWNENNRSKINFPEFNLNPMRVLFNGKYTGPFPTGDILLKKYSTEKLRYSIASMGEGQSSFNPEKLINSSLEKDNIDFKYDAILKKIKRLVGATIMQMTNEERELVVPEETVEFGNELFNQYENIMFNRQFSKAIDLIEEKFKYILNDRQNVVYNTKMILIMMYPFLPQFIEKIYKKIYKDNELYENYNPCNTRIIINKIENGREEANAELT